MSEPVLLVDKSEGIATLTLIDPKPATRQDTNIDINSFVDSADRDLPSAGYPNRPLNFSAGYLSRFLIIFSWKADATSRLSSLASANA